MPRQDETGTLVCSSPSCVSGFVPVATTDQAPTIKIALGVSDFQALRVNRTLCAHAKWGQIEFLVMTANALERISLNKIFHYLKFTFSILNI